MRREPVHADVDPVRAEDTTAALDETESGDLGSRARRDDDDLLRTGDGHPARDYAAAMPVLPPFQASVAPVSVAGLGRSWHRGCPVGPAGLRTLTVSFVGFDGHAHSGRLVVASSVTREVTTVFRALYRSRFPIR